MLLKRVKHSVIAFIVAVLLIVVVIAVAFGDRIKAAMDSGEKMGVHFLLAVLYPERYSYSTEKADLNEYYRIFSDDDIAIVLQDELIATHAKLYDDVVYFSLATVEELFTDRFYYNADEAVLLYTTRDSVTTVHVGADSYEVDGVSTDMGYPIARIGSEGALYVAADYVRRYADFSYDFYPSPNRMQVYTRWGTDRVATLRQDTKVRYQGGIKSDILCAVEMGDEVIVLEVMESWTKVKTRDCYIGYVENSVLNDYEERAAAPVRDAYHPEEDYAMTPPTERVLLGFHMLGTPDDGSGLSVLAGAATGMNAVSPTWYFLNSEDGTYSSRASASYVASAHARGYQVWALVEDMSNDFDRYALFSSSEHRAALIDSLVGDAVAMGVDGLNLDCERIDARTGPHYVQFLRELSIRLHQEGLVLSVDDYVPNEGNRYYDLREQGYVADYVVMMGYDEHWAGSDAGSVASIGFVERGIESMLSLGVPVEKLVVAVPFYTRIWCVEGARTTSEAVGMDTAAEWVRVRGLETTWEEESCQNYAEYQDGTATYMVWLEDAESMTARAAVIAQHGVRSVGAWRLGLESAGTWDILDAVMR